MPTLPTYTKCIELGCKEQRIGKGSFCQIHSIKKEVTQERWDRQKQYKSPFWRHMKRTQLSRSPLCVCCLIAGRVCQASVVDHVFPWAQVGEHAFTHNLFQSLCVECHSHKTVLEQRGVIEHYTNKTMTYSLSDYGYMVAHEQILVET
jgi:5-methylcytosine-specific restriction endonuclease McrA